jgi:hypothetical protein
VSSHCRRLELPGVLDCAWKTRLRTALDECIAYLQLFFDLMGAQAPRWRPRLALDSCSRHVPCKHPQEDGQGQQGPVSPRDHGEMQFGSIVPNMECVEAATSQGCPAVSCPLGAFGMSLSIS